MTIVFIYANSKQKKIDDENKKINFKTFLSLNSTRRSNKFEFTRFRTQLQNIKNEHAKKKAA